MPGTEAASPLLIYMVKQVELAVRARLDEIVRPAGFTALQETARSVLERHTDMSSAPLARAYRAAVHGAQCDRAAHPHVLGNACQFLVGHRPVDGRHDNRARGPQA